MYRTAFRLRKRIASKPESLRSASSSSRQSSGGANPTIGSSRTSAPSASSARMISRACSGARVITRRFPASGFLSISSAASRKAQNAIRARFKQNMPEPFTDFFCIFRGATLFAPEMLLAVGGKHTTFKKQATSSQPRPGSERDLATPFKLAKECTLRRHAETRGLVVECRDQCRSFAIGFTRFDSQCALTYRRKHDFSRKYFRNFLAHPQAIHSGFLQNDGVIFTGRHFLQACVHVAAQFNGPQVWAV